MTSDWIEEGSLQLRLALLWERHALALVARPRGAAPEPRPGRDTPPDDTRVLADAVHEQAFRQAVLIDWFPGARRLAEFVVRKWEKNELPDAATVNAQVDRFSDNLRDGFARAAQRAAPAEPEPTDRHEAPLMELISWAVNAALKTREATAEPPASAATLPASATLAPPPRQAAAAWLSLASALSAWGKLAHQARRQDEAESYLARVPRLALECSELSNWVNEWRRGALAFGPFVGGTGTFGALLQNVEHCLGRCSDALTQLQAQRTALVNEQALRERRDSLRLIDAAISRAPQGWPPLVLAELQEEFDRRGPTSLATALADAAAQLPPDDLTDPRALAVLAVADRLTAAGVAPDHAAWEALERAAGRLFGAAVGADGTPGVQVIRSDDGTSEAVQREENDRLTATQPPLLRRAGLVVRKGNRPEVVRHAVVELGRRRPPAVALLRKLARALAREPDEADAGELATLFSRVAHDLATHRDLESWWASATTGGEPERLGRFWQAVQRAAALAPERGPAGAAAADLLAELSGAFQFVPPTGDGPAPGIWLLAPDARAREATPLDGAPSAALRGPDGLVLQPAGWLRVPKRWEGVMPSLKRLHDAQPLISGLRALDPAWDGWSDAGGLAWDTAFRGAGGSPGGFEPGRARGAFEAAYTRGQRTDDPLAPAFLELARRLHAALQDAGTPVSPALDPTTLRPLAAASALPPGTDIRYVVSDEPAGTVVKVARFGVGSAPAAVTVSLGKKPPREAAAWINYIQGPPTAEGDEPPAVRAWRAELPGLMSRPDGLESRSRVRRSEFLDWAATEPGREAFDRLVRRAAQTDDGTGVAAARGLVAALTQSGWCQVAPAVDPATGCGVWPRGRRADSAARVEWAVRPGVALGQAAPEKFRFAPSLELVEGAFSLGTPDHGSALAAALRLDRAARSEPRAGSGLRATARAVLAAQIDEELGAPAVAATGLLGPVLDALVTAARAYPEAGQAFDEVLAATRDWASARGLTVRPSSWSFAAPPPFESLGREGLVAPKPEFSADAPTRALSLSSLGWSGGPAGSDRTPTLALSAGPAPPHYEALRERLAAATNWSAAANLLAEMDGWPAKQVEGADVLRFEVEHLFSAFWDAAGPPPRAAEIEQAAATLERLLRDGFHLETFVPSSINDVDADWYRVFARGGAKTGRVSRVIRPGLRSPTEGLCFVAWVDVE